MRKFHHAFRRAVSNYHSTNYFGGYWDDLSVHEKRDLVLVSLQDYGVY